MIRIGMCGMGKLGLPVALALNSFGFDVCGTDINKEVEQYLITRKIPYKEELADVLLKVHKIIWYENIGEVIRSSDVIFMPIQTPHEERYEGITRLPPERKDFDYSHLRKAVSDFVVQMALSSDPSPKTLVIISTVLPGTIRREIIPLVKDDKRINLVYNPFFIAMGTTIHDFLNPEFVLIGMDQLRIPVQLLKVYEKIYAGEKFRPQSDFYQVMSIESAELTKVAYNTFITSKICIVNTLMEICHKIPGANIDDVTGALKNATKRIVSPMYMNGGVGDGGGCTTGDTLIPLLNGTTATIKDLVGKEFWVYSYDIQKNIVVPGKAFHCRKTKTNADVFEVKLDNGEIIKVTKDHPFLLRNGNYVNVEELKAGSSIMPLYRRIFNGYEQIRVLRNNKQRQRWKWIDTHKILTQDMIGETTHHDDLNKINNEPTNLQKTSHKEHRSIHGKEAVQRPYVKRLLSETATKTLKRLWQDDEYKKKQSERTSLQNSKRLKEQSELMTKLNADGRLNSKEQRRKTSIRNKTNNVMWNKDTVKKSRENMIASGVLERNSKRMIANNPMKDETTKINMVKSKIINIGGLAIVQYGRLNEKTFESCRPLSCPPWKSIEKYFSNYDQFQKDVSYRFGNHRVISINYIGKEDVYNFEVEKHHNYALSAGVFVHNCHPRDNIAMSWLADKVCLSYDWFENLMISREKQAEFFANLIMENYTPGDKVHIIGSEFKPQTNLTTGSHVLLVAEILKENHINFEIRNLDETLNELYWIPENGKLIFFIGCKHKEFEDFIFPSGSVVLDPFRFIFGKPGVKVISIGEGLKVKL